MAKLRVSTQSGNSLIQVLIAVAITGIIAITVASMISMQNREAKALGEKLAIRELQITLTNLVSNLDYCGCVFRGRTFNTSSRKWNFNISSLPYSFVMPPPPPGTACARSSDVVVPKVGDALGVGNLRIKAIDIINVHDLGGGNYNANLYVGVDHGERTLQGANVNFQFAVDLKAGTPAARPLYACGDGQTLKFLEVLEVFADKDGDIYGVPIGLSEDKDWFYDPSDIAHSGHDQDKCPNGMKGFQFDYYRCDNWYGATNYKGNGDGACVRKVLCDYKDYFMIPPSSSKP